MKYLIKKGIKNILQQFGFEVRRIEKNYYKHGFNHTFKRVNKLKQLGFEPKVICDVGASNGRWTRKCLEIYPNGHYFLVEPLEENKLGLENLKRDFPNTNYWLGCLGATVGTVLLNADGSGTSILKGHWGNYYGEQRETSMETLDNLIQQGICPTPDFLKLDVQGYELEVLKGAVSALNSVQAIIAEVSFIRFQEAMPVFHEVVKQIAKYGFVVSDILDLSLRPLDKLAGQANLLFLENSHLLISDNKWDKDSEY